MSDPVFHLLTSIWCCHLKKKFILAFWLLLLLLSHFSRVRLCVTPQTAAHQGLPSLGFSRQEHWSGLPFPSPMHESEKWKWSHSVSVRLFTTPWTTAYQTPLFMDFPGKSTGVGCHCLLCHYRGLECKSRKSRNTWSNRQMRPWSMEWNRAKANKVLPENALVIANTLFQQHKRRLYTWTSSDGQHRNQIEYILCSQKWRSSIQSAKTRLGADCGSDYELLIAKLQLKWKKVGKTH